MKIALVHEYLTNFAGSEQVLLALHELYPEAPIFTAMYYPDRCPQFRNADIRTSFLQKFPRIKEKVYIPLLPLAVEGYDLSDYDVVISDSHVAAKGVITKPDAVHICYCHTPIRYAWSPEVDPRASRSPLRRLAAHYLRLWDYYAAQRVDHFIANSTYIAGRIKKYYKADATVIYPPVDIEQLSLAQQPPLEDYYVFFSRLIDYKKPDVVIEAFNRLGKKLIVLGRGPMADQLKDMAGPNIQIITDFLPYSEIATLFGKAAAMVFPAEEDFGIAMVDMLACGRPVIAYGAGGATDIVIPGKTGELFHEQSVEAIMDAVARFDPMGYDSTVIKKHAAQFSSTLFKQRIQSFVERAVQKGK
jgi:glycosyltransferase involved in cell wall biosynthesis